MSNSCYRNPIVRDGTSQQLRLVSALLPEYVSVDERNFEELKQFVKNFSRELNFYDNEDKVNGDWYDFFDKNIDANQRTEPHYALFQAFLELFKIAQADLNTLTKRHLDYYYNEVLRLTPNEPVSDQVFIIFELARHISDKGYLIEKGTRLKAGKDDLGNNIFYETSQDLVINKSQVKEIKSIFKDLGNSRLYSSPITNSSDGIGGEILTDIKGWRPFGNAERPTANIGFALSSPILNLAEGTRNIHIKINFKDISEEQENHLKELSFESLNNAFDVTFSGEEEWINGFDIDGDPSQDEFTKMAAEKATSFINKCNSWEEIAGKEPSDGPILDSPFSGYGDQSNDYDIGITVAQRIITERNKLDGKAFTNLEDLKKIDGVGDDKISDLTYTFTRAMNSSYFDFNSKTLHLVRTVSKDQSPIVGFNREVLLDAFETTLPTAKILLNDQHDDVCAYDLLIDLEIVSAEILVDVNGVQNLVVQNDQTLMDPSKTMLPFGIIPVLGGTFYIGSREVFQKALSSLQVNLEWYGAPEDEDFESYYSFYLNDRANDVFKTDISILDKKTWKLLDSGKNLFSFTSLRKPVNKIQLIDLNQSQLVQVSRDVNLGEVDNFNTGTQKGFIRLELVNSDFGHKEYQIAFTQQILKNLNSEDQNVPKEPYVPQLKSVFLNYKSSVFIDLENEAGDCVEQFFQVTPFGAAEQTSTGSELDKCYFLPQFRSEGEIFIGIENLDAPQNLSLLIQMLEGSEDPTIARPLINWSYLSDNEWVTFNQLDILSDTSNGLLKSGILNFSIPKDATANNTILTQGLHWLRASVEEGSMAIPDFIQASTQAVIAEFQNNNNDPNYLSQALQADSVGRLEFSDSAISNVSQPFASFGGRVNEQSTTFYTRVSERLRHKQRAITIWDYERLVLEKFPLAYKVKCLNHTRFDGKLAGYSELAPGNVTMIIISNVRNRNSVDPIRPLTSINILEEIKEFLSSFNSAPVALHVKNPIYEEIKVDFKVKFRRGFDIGFYKRQLEDEIKAFLSPWAYENSPDISFGGKIHQSRIIDFIDEREYVDFVTCFQLFHPAASPVQPVTEALATTTASILCSAGQVNTYGDHLINVLEVEEYCEPCNDNLIDPPPVVLSADSCDEVNLISTDEETIEMDGFSRPDLSACLSTEEDEEDCEDLPSNLGEFIFTQPNNQEVFKEYNDGLIPLKLDATYFLPASLTSFINLPLSEIVDRKTIKLNGDFTNGSYSRIENIHQIEDNPDVYRIVQSGINKPVFEDGQTTFKLSNSISRMSAGDKINLYRPDGKGFKKIFLPKVSQEMVRNESTIRFQIIISDGKSIEFRRSEERGFDRLQAFDSNETSTKSIDLVSGAGVAVYSVELKATSFNRLENFNSLGWKVIRQNENYFNSAFGSNSNNELNSNDESNDEVTGF